MVAIQAIQKRGFLECLYENGLLTGLTLLETLKAFRGASFDSRKTGRIIVSTSGDEGSVSFAYPQMGREFSQNDFFAMQQFFVELYRFAVATNTANSVATDDASVLQTMLADQSMQTVTSQMYDHTLLGVPNSFGPAM